MLNDSIGFLFTAAEVTGHHRMSRLLLQIEWVVHRQAQMRLDHNWTGLKSIITKSKILHPAWGGGTKPSRLCSSPEAAMYAVRFWVPGFACTVVL